MANITRNDMSSILDRLKAYFLQIKDAVKTVNGQTPDADGDITIEKVDFATDLESSSTQYSEGTYIDRTSGGEASIKDGDAWLVNIRGNAIHSGKVDEVLSLEVISEVETSMPDWFTGFVCDGALAGVFAILGFLPQILVLFLLFAIMEDTGYMARVAFILDKLFRKFGLSGRAFIPMIMGFGCSVPAMVNTRTLADDKEKTATIRVIPFFSCGAKLPILTGIAGGIAMSFGFKTVDVITYSMYVVGIAVAIISVLLMRNTTMRGEAAPFIMELPEYHIPQFKSLMVHLWDKAKHFIQKAFTIILASTIVIWFLSNFGWNWKYLGEMEGSILQSLGQLIQPIFTPLGFGAQLTSFGWVFAVAAITGLIAKENVIATFSVLAAVVVAGFEGTADGAEEVAILIQATGISWQGCVSFIAFNMLTIPCFAACATAKAELPKGKFIWTILFWIVTSFAASATIYSVLSCFSISGSKLAWSIPVTCGIVVLVALSVVGIILFNKYRDKKKARA